jgi:cellulose synthase/poly-beta-1,6-N-acetylglucosamine synthase-like glycosyltransferase
MGVEKANHAIILCTDDDCLPAGQNWIKSMVTHAGEGNVVLGYSPYFQKAGRLNLFIRFETIMTGMQYLSWAMLGSAFMGVGRNMLFPKSVFLQNQLHQKARDVVYGDDDLFVQAIRGKVPVKVSMDPDSFIYTQPPETVKEYMKQKHRHLSAGHYYSVGAWLKPGIFGIGIILHWLFLIPMLWCNVNVTFAIAFFAGILIRWIVYATWTNRLG